MGAPLLQAAHAFPGTPESRGVPGHGPPQRHLKAGCGQGRPQNPQQSRGIGAHNQGVLRFAPIARYRLKQKLRHRRRSRSDQYGRLHVPGKGRHRRKVGRALRTGAQSRKEAPKPL